MVTLEDVPVPLPQEEVGGVVTDAPPCLGGDPWRGPIGEPMGGTLGGVHGRDPYHTQPYGGGDQRSLPDWTHSHGRMTLLCV